MNVPIFVLSHGRPECKTYNVLMRLGYTGEVHVLVDDMDDTGDEYVSRYGSAVIVFDRRKEELSVDYLDAYGVERSTGVAPARNAALRIAREMGYDRCWQFDDDIDGFALRGRDRHDSDICDGRRFAEILSELDDIGRGGAIPALGLNMAEHSGDHGDELRYEVSVAMNLMTDGTVTFKGRYYEDVATSMDLIRRGYRNYSTNAVIIRQKPWYYEVRDSEVYRGGLCEHYGRGAGRDVRLAGVMAVAYWTVVCPGISRLVVRRRGGGCRPMHRNHEVTPKLIADKWVRK